MSQLPKSERIESIEMPEVKQPRNAGFNTGLTNFRVPAGRAVAVLKEKLQGLMAIAPVGYSNEGLVVHERIGFIQHINPDPTCGHAAFDFLYTDEEGTAETTIVDDEEITLCLLPHQLHWLEKFQSKTITKTSAVGFSMFVGKGLTS